MLFHCIFNKLLLKENPLLMNNMSSGITEGLFNFFGARTPSPTNMSPVGSPKGPQVTAEIREISNAIISQTSIPSDFVYDISVQLEKVLTKVDSRRFPELVQRAGTPCVSEYLKDVFVLLQSQIASAEKGASQFKPGPDRDEFLASVQQQKETYFVSIAQLLGQGFEVALKPNLEFDVVGNPIGVREKDRTRFPNCHAYLTSRMGGKRRKTKKQQKKKRKTLRRRKLHR
jgi:hypothetical protein